MLTSPYKQWSFLLTTFSQTKVTGPLSSFSLMMVGQQSETEMEVVSKMRKILYGTHDIFEKYDVVE